MTTTDRLAALLHGDDPTGEGPTPYCGCELLAARLVAQGVTVGIDPERLARALERVDRIEIVYGGYDKAATQVVRAYEEASDATN